MYLSNVVMKEDLLDLLDMKLENLLRFPLNPVVVQHIEFLRSMRVLILDGKL